MEEGYDGSFISSFEFFFCSRTKKNKNQITISEKVSIIKILNEVFYWI